LFTPWYDGTDVWINFPSPEGGMLGKKFFSPEEGMFGKKISPSKGGML
jgi:hypothetical protein